MSRKRFTMEQIIGLLREVDVKVSQGRSVEQICREIGITEPTYYRWRKEYGGMKTVQVKRLKELEKENTHLKKAVAELTLDKLILKEAVEGNY
jgi:putative transposase